MSVARTKNGVEGRRSWSVPVCGRVRQVRISDGHLIAPSPVHVPALRHRPCRHCTRTIEQSVAAPCTSPLLPDSSPRAQNVLLFTPRCAHLGCSLTSGDASTNLLVAAQPVLSATERQIFLGSPLVRSRPCQLAP